MGLSDPTDAARAAREELWTPEKPTRADGFFQLFVTKNPALTLNGFRGVHSGSAVGVSSASPNSLNARHMEDYFIPTLLALMGWSTYVSGQVHCSVFLGTLEDYRYVLKLVYCVCICQPATDHHFVLQGHR